jgi:tRNA A37 threonylcarbamoyladenosine synthetase subunit TsaC/SUA5/YrdC
VGDQRVIRRDYSPLTISGRRMIEEQGARYTEQWEQDQLNVRGAPSQFPYDWIVEFRLLETGDTFTLRLPDSSVTRPLMKTAGDYMRVSEADSMRTRLVPDVLDDEATETRNVTTYDVEPSTLVRVTVDTFRNLRGGSTWRDIRTLR